MAEEKKEETRKMTGKKEEEEEEERERRADRERERERVINRPAVAATNPK